MSAYSLVLPADFADHEWEVSAKGCFPNAPVVIGRKRYRVNFYDAVRLGQEIESGLESGRVFFEPNLVIVRSVTRAEMEAAMDQLVQFGQVTSLTPE